MEHYNISSNVYSQLDEVSRFIKFNRKKIAGSIRKTLKGYEQKISSISLLEKKLQDLQDVHDEVNTKYNLVSRILGAKCSDNKAMQEFNSLVENDFLTFANQENSLAEEAKAVLIIQSIQRELQMISGFPDVYNKNVVAVGGGFSAGKSEFISSFFTDKTVKLPIGIKPVTAIPTYISNGDKHIIKGYSYKGGSVDIAFKLYAELSHDFIKSFSFNLKDIISMMAIKTKFKNFKDICFIDTPGYNPAITGQTDGDYQTAREHLENANVLLWVIGLDASDGAIPASDLDFLSMLPLEGKKIFVIANKADLKSGDDLKDILDNFEYTLNTYDIDFCGISAYKSTNNATEIDFRKKSLLDFLREIDNPVSAADRVTSKLNEVLDMYETAIKKQLKWTKSIKSHLNSLELDFMQSGYESKKLDKRLGEIKAVLEENKLKRQLEDLNDLKNKMTSSADHIFKSIQT